MSFPSLGFSLGSAGGTRRVTPRIRHEPIAHNNTKRDDGTITEWTHPKDRMAWRAADAAARGREREKAKDEATAAAAAASGRFVPPPAAFQLNRLRSDSKSSLLLSAGPLPTPSSLLLASYVPGMICTLNRKVGKIVFVGYLSSLDGCWVCLATYRSHGIGRKAVFDFHTVRHELRGAFLVPLEAPESPEDGSLRIQVMGIGLENYEEKRCEVEMHVIAKAQREAMRLLGATCAGDHAVFVRVDDPKMSDLIMSRQPSAATTSVAKDQPTLLPALSTPRTGSSTGGSGGGSATNSPTIGPTPRRKKKGREKELGGTKENNTPTHATTRDSAHKTPKSTTNTESKSMPQPTIVDVKENPPSVVVAPEESPSDSPPSIPAPPLPSPPPAPASLPTHPPFGVSPVPVALDSESRLPLIARQLQLTGPFAEVDALALSAPAHLATTPYVLSKYLTSYFPHTVSTSEKKARVLFRWLCAHISWSGSPLKDRLQTGERLKLEPSSTSSSTTSTMALENEIQTTKDGATNEARGGKHEQTITNGEMPTVKQLRQLSIQMEEQEKADLEFDIHPPMSPTGTSGSSSSPAIGHIHSKASAFHRMELGFGPSRKSAMRTSKGRSNRIAGDVDGHASSFDTIMTGYSSDDADDAHDDVGHDVVEAVLKQSALKGTDSSSSSSSSSSLPSSSSRLVDFDPNSASGVLHSRSGTPYGFAVLFQAMAAIAGLECIIVRGLIKYGPEYRRRQDCTIEQIDGKRVRTKLTRSTDHTLPITAYSDWNLCRIDRHWYAIDCFSSAGQWDVDTITLDHLDGRFIRRFSPCYFAPSPETFILNHFPLFVYKHTNATAGVEQMTSDTHRKYRTVVGSNVSNALQTLDRIDSGGGSSIVGGMSVDGLTTTKDPLQLSTLELIKQPRALQLIQPPISKAEFDLFVNVSRAYIEYSIETYENEYDVTYGINALGSGVAGTTFVIEIEVPIWLDAGIELCKMSLDADDEEQTESLGRESDTPPTGILSSPTISSPAGHARSPSFARTFVKQLADGIKLDPSLSSTGSSVGTANGGVDVSVGSSTMVIPSEIRSPRHVAPPPPPLASSEYDLTTCAFAQKAVGTRLEIRQTPAANVAATSATGMSGVGASSAIHPVATLQKHKKIQHRTRMKIHLVFPKQGKYRAIIYCKNPLTSPSSSSSGSSSLPSNSDSSSISPSDDPSHWAPLMEYSITVNQGVADLPKRKVTITHPLKPVLPPVIDPTLPPDTPIVPTTPPPIVNVPLPRHLFVGFMQLYKPTFELPSIRMIGHQIVCVRPWSGTWELGTTFQLQFVCPKDVVEMLVVTDGRWSPFNQGQQGFVATKYATVQQELLNQATPPSQDTKARGDHHHHHHHHHHHNNAVAIGENVRKSKAPLIQYHQGQERRIFTLDWCLLSCPELYIYFKVDTRYYLLNYFLPDRRNYIKDESKPLSKSEQRRLNHLGAIIPTISFEQRRDPLMLSRFFIPQNGVAFETQLHYHASVISSNSIAMTFDCLRDTSIRGRLVEGWMFVDAASRLRYGTAGGDGGSGVIVADSLTARELYSDSIRIEPVVEVDAPLSHEERTYASMPKHLRPTSSIIAATTQATATTRAGETNTDGTIKNPLHQRMRLTASIPSPDAIQNTSSTRHFTLLLYVCSHDEVRSLDDSSDVPTIDVTPSKDSNANDDRTFRFAFSQHIYATEEDQVTCPPPYQTNHAQHMNHTAT